ncbi:efflux RND transporter permease subunit [Allorhodopirellula solitaria]|uniref:MMPL family protein n=1 Tax=Allorhodopirellula solitaria TaxID=2527987 RepID=A0A5C5XRL5_9BACT|nr:MMPL family transporter [Allorhodopirellula solitaria]TWT65279.1 MMPL family protein [Allorhodopirellula solitaria]
MSHLNNQRPLKSQVVAGSPTRPALLARSADRLAAVLVRWRVWLLVIGCLGFIPLAYLQSGLTMNRSLAAMFASDDPALLDYQRMQSRFGGNLVVMWVYDDEELMTAEGLARSRLWTERVESIDGVEGVLSVAKLVDAFRFLRPSLSSSLSLSESTGEPLFRTGDAVAAQFRDLFAGYTHSADEKTAAIVVMLKGTTAAQPDRVSQSIAQLRSLAAEMPASSASSLIGEPVLLEDAFDLILADGRRLAIGTIGLLCLVILVTLRDLRVVILAAICIVWSTVATRAWMVVAGVELSLVSTILLALVSVIVVAAIMHLAVRCRVPGASCAAAIAMLAIPIACTCFTDAAGFAALMISQVRPVAEFGAMTAAAAVCVLVSLALFSPAMMSLSDRWGLSRKRARESRAPGNEVDTAEASQTHLPLRTLATVSVRQRLPLSIAAIVLLAGSTYYVMGLDTNSSFLENFRADSPIVRDYERVENRFGGAGVWDVSLPAPAVITPEYLDEVRSLEDQLRNIQIESVDSGSNDRGDVRLRKVLSLADADAVAAQVTMLSFVSPGVRLTGMRAAIPAFTEALLTFSETSQPTQPRRLRIMLRSDESLSGEEKSALMDEVNQTVQAAVAQFTHPGATADQHERANSSEWDEGGVVTGYSVLMSRMVSSLVRDQWTTLAVALAAVGLLLLVVTADWRLTIVSLIVNALPILVVLSCMGWFGGQLDLGSAMIGAVSIGLSIDGSIHFLSGYQRRRSVGQPSEVAAVEAAADLGAPILLANIALVVGFAVLITSPFVPTATFGLLVAATLTISAFANLTLLPAMVVFASSPRFVLSQR